MKRPVLILALFLMLPIVSTAQTCGGATPSYTAASWADLSDCFSKATHNNDTITITQNISMTGSQLTWNAKQDASLLGQGDLSVTGGGDVTTITDDDASNHLPLTINIDATAGHNFRMAGLTIAGGTGVLKDNGLVQINGPGTIRIDHTHWNIQSYSLAVTPLTIGDRVYGVIDHSILDLYTNGAIHVVNGSGPDGQGNTSWASDTNFGTASFFFAENNVFNGDVPSTFPSRTTDTFSAGRLVLRYNTLGFMAGPEPHATGHSGDDRGQRAGEVYQNHFVMLPGEDVNPRGPAQDIADMSSGPTMVWGNIGDTGTLKTGYALKTTRKGYQTYAQPPVPSGWGYCGPSTSGNAPAIGTVNVIGGTTVAWASGTTFDTSWPADSMIIITGALCDSASSPGITTSCGISSVNTSTSITLSQTVGGSGVLTGAAYYVGSAWDQNAETTTGNACIDQTGRGKGDMLSGTFGVGGGKINNASGIVSWPNQALEPGYIWMDSFTPAPGWGNIIYGNESSGRIVADRDYYEQASAANTNGASPQPFTGTTGTGWGTRANRPMSCTTGVVYWSVDQGSWNAGNLGTGITIDSITYYNGVLDKCTGTNTWTNAVYTPYTYPHPLDVPSTCTPTSLAFGTQPVSAVLGGSLGSVTVAVKDVDGVTTCTSSSASITIAKGAGSPGGTLNGTLTVNASSGVATFSDLNVTVTAGTYTLTASSSMLTDGTSNSFAVGLPTTSGAGPLIMRLKP